MRLSAAVMTSQEDPPALAALARTIADRRLPPVSRWNPARTGSIDIRIRADGRWEHEGSVIERPAMVALFASILRRDDQGYWLVTPVEKLSIRVDVAPFLIIAFVSEGEGRERRIGFTLNTDDAVIAGPANALRMSEGPYPLVHVRDGLDALISRPVYYELMALALAQSPPQGPIGLWSDGVWFDFGTADLDEH